MKKTMVMAAVCALAAVSALGDTYTWKSDELTSSTQAQYSAVIPVSGWFVKAEFSQSTAVCTSIVDIASYTSAGLYLHTNALVTLDGTTPQVVRTRVSGSDKAGTALNYNGGGTNYASTILSVPYEMDMLGGNTKIHVYGTKVAASGTNVVTVTIYYLPTKK